MIDSFEVREFKKIERAQLALGGMTVFVGGNNSGKSCLLQAMHFGSMLAVGAARAEAVRAAATPLSSAGHHWPKAPRGGRP